MEFFNLILFIIIIFNFVNISSYNRYKEKVSTIVDNAAKIDAKNEQSVNTDAIKVIKATIAKTLDTIKKYPEYKKIVDIIGEMKVSLSLLAGEQYAMDKTQIESNKAPHELNIIQVGKLEYSIKDKGASLGKQTDIFDKQIQTAWAGIIMCLIVIIFVNFFWNKFI
jgi:hypothetical protein